MAAFRSAALKAGLDPDDRWVGGYVEYEWRHLRHVLAAYDAIPGGQRMLELGCNIGGSSIVCAALGAHVEAVDVDPGFVSVAQANVRLHALEAAIRAQAVPDTRSLPFADAAFDFALANSVLEYVHHTQLPGVLAELARVVKPGGRLLICGTSNRLAPREMHSRRWLVNYVPRRLAPVPMRGIAPWRLARLLAPHFRVVERNRWLDARRAVHGHASPAKRALATLADGLGIAPGWLSPSIEILVERR